MSLNAAQVYIFSFQFPAGRYNPLQSILLMLYLLKKDNYGEIAGVSLGPAGLNLLSVFNDK